MPRTVSTARPYVLAALALACSVLLGACAGGGAQREPGDSTSYVAKYARGDYSGAKSTALAQASKASGIEKDRANLIAGLSAAQLSENSEATRYLSPLTGHSDPEIAGRATAGMGLVARNQGEKAKGASLMSEGAKKLTGDTAAKAHLGAGDTYAEIGAKDQAMAEYRAGAGVAQRPDLKASLQERLEGKRYTVQVGAFSSRSNADRKAGEVRSKAESLGLGAPRIQSGSANGKTSYMVQIGNYPTRQDAKLAAMKMGSGAVVAQIDM